MKLQSRSRIYYPVETNSFLFCLWDWIGWFWRRVQRHATQVRTFHNNQSRGHWENLKNQLPFTALFIWALFNPWPWHKGTITRRYTRQIVQNFTRDYFRKKLEYSTGSNGGHISPPPLERSRGDSREQAGGGAQDVTQVIFALPPHQDHVIGRLWRLGPVHGFLLPGGGPRAGFLRRVRRARRDGGRQLSKGPPTRVHPRPGRVQVSTTELFKPRWGRHPVRPRPSWWG